MNIINKIGYIVGVLLVLGSCTTMNHKLKIADISYERNSNQQDTVLFEIDVELDGKTLNKRERLVLLPQLIGSISPSIDTVLSEYTPMIIEGEIYRKKMERRKVLYDYEDSYEKNRYNRQVSCNDIRMKWKDYIVLPQSVDTFYLRGLVTTDGCSECTCVDTLLMATIFPSGITKDSRSKDIKYETRLIEKRGELSVFFDTDRYVIDGRKENHEILSRLLSELRVVSADSLSELEYIGISGYASPEGSTDWNIELAEKRALAAAEWLQGEGGFGDVMIDISSQHVSWNDVLAEMIYNNDSCAEDLRRIINLNSSNIIMEKKIRALPCWTNIKDRYLPQRRIVTYVYRYRTKVVEKIIK